ncbi:MAG: hypothetical protein IKE69_13185 [Thermoguttaceae bacterium]|nr:hypothetical protein [Thermoguttaceae bacterium]
MEQTASRMLTEPTTTSFKDFGILEVPLIEQTQYPFVPISKTRNVLFFFSVALFLSLFFHSYLSAQGWQEYAEQIRHESQNKDLQNVEPSIPEPTFSVSGNSNGFNPDGIEFLAENIEMSDTLPETSPHLRPNPVSTDPSIISDASLFGLCQAASGIIWAVGDRGAVWMSSDNGEKWFLVRVPTTANLKAVSFSDANHGLIVGGNLIPGTKSSQGIILRTEDGGRNWSVVETIGIPFLYDVAYSEDGIAEAWGDSSELYPSGYFQSEDNGRTWFSPFRTVRHPGWIKGNSENEFFSGLSRSGKPYQIDGTSCNEIGAFQNCDFLTDFTMSENAALFSAGLNGLLLWDGTSLPQQIPLPSESDQFEFNTVSFKESRIDIAGTPGTKIFSSTDNGRSWNATETGITLPIRKILFSDSQNGFAVGDLGNILVTHDGGANWTVKREGGRRAAWLGLFENSELIPYHWTTALTLKDGFLGVADILTPCDESCGEEVHPEERLRESFIATGGSSFHYENDFALPSPELNLSLENIKSLWSNRTNEAPEIMLKRHIVRMIRIWRPTLLVLSEKNDPPAFLTPPVRSLVTDESIEKNRIRPTAGYSTVNVDPIKLALMVEQHWDISNKVLPMRDLQSPISQMIRDTILEGIIEAADPQRFPEQIKNLGLLPWKVNRVGIATDRSSFLSVKTEDYISTHGRTIDEVSLLAQRIASPHNSLEAFRGFEFISLEGVDNPDINSQLDSPFVDLNIPRGSEIRRRAAVHPISEKKVLPIIRQRRKLLALADHLTSSSGSRVDMIRTNIDTALQETDTETAAEVLLRLGINLSHAGDPDTAAEYWERLVSEYPETTPAREGAVRLLRMYAGLERIRRISLGRAAKIQVGTITQNSKPDEVERPLPGIVDHCADALRIGTMIREYYPELYMTDEVRFPLASAQRRGGEFQNAIGYYYNRSLLFSENDFTARHAAGEYALLNDKQEKSDFPLPVGSCYPAVSVPLLDGILENEVWNVAEPFQLAGDPNYPQTSISLLSGKEHLFIGIVAHQTDVTAIQRNGQRVRDTDLSDFDRIEIALDPDRDFIDFYHLTFDCRGWVCDSCHNDKNWNPEIYIAQKATNFGWVLEIAIPWRELCDSAPNAGNIWGIAIRRVVPGIGFSAWSEIGKKCLKKGFGYLHFY